MVAYLSKEIYIHYCDNNIEKIPLYYTPRWLNAVCDDLWDAVVVKDDHTVYGIMPLHIKKKVFLTCILQPKFTPFQGPLIFYPNNLTKTESRNSFLKKILTLVFDALPKHHLLKIKLHHTILDWQPMKWKNFKQSSRYTYIIDTNQSINQLFENISSKTRNQINSAKETLSISEDNDLTTLFDLTQQTFLKQGLKNPYSILDFQKMKSASHYAFVMHAEDSSKNIQAAMMFLGDHQYLYGQVAGRLDNAHSGAMALLLWNGILRAKELGLKYDFEGSDLSSVEPLYRSFGGDHVPYFSLYKSDSKLIDTLMLLLNKL
jgi:hypothetical protein